MFVVQQEGKFKILVAVPGAVYGAGDYHFPFFMQCYKLIKVVIEVVIGVKIVIEVVTFY